MLTTEHVLEVFPGIDAITDRRLRQLSLDVWRYVSERNPTWSDIGRIPLHPTMPIATHGTLIAHVTAMARLAETLASLYRELWAQDLDLDTFRAAAYVHDAAKVIEFTDGPAGLQAIAGYNHAIEAGRIVRELGGPAAIAHMAEAHSFSGSHVPERVPGAGRRRVRAPSQSERLGATADAGALPPRALRLPGRSLLRYRWPLALDLRMDALRQHLPTGRAIPLLVGLIGDLSFDEQLGELPPLGLALERHGLGAAGAPAGG